MMIGEILQELRKDKNLIQQDIADYLNVSIAAISHYESGKNIPDINTICKLADYFKVSVDYMLRRTRVKFDWNVLDKKFNLPNNKEITLDEVVSIFDSLDPESKAETLKYMNLLQLKPTR